MAASSWSDPGPDDETLADAFWSVARRLRFLTRETVGPFGITPGQDRALSVLRRHGAIRLSEVSNHLRIAPRSTTEVIDGLEEAGLVERSPDPTDRRATLVTLTRNGEELASRVRAARAAEGDAFFSRLDDADRAALGRILRALRS
jgi:DNA-binding MarR family transcriptional regulator